MNAGPDWEAGGAPEPSSPAGPQPMRLGTILEVGARILRRHWPVLLLLALLFAGPGALLTAATGSRFNEIWFDILPELTEERIAEGPILTRAESERLLEALGAYLLASIVAGVLASIGALAFSAVVAADYHARRLELPVALGMALRRTPSALAFMLITTLVIVGLALVGVVGVLLATMVFPAGSGGGPGAFLALVVVVAVAVATLYLTMRWAPAYPVMINESSGWREALSRSWHLSGDNIWRIFAIIALATIASILAAAVLAQILALVMVGALAPALGLDELIAESIALALGTVLLAPLTPVMTAVLYFDLRARRDRPGAGAATPGPS